MLTGAAKSSLQSPQPAFQLMGTIVIGVIAALLLVYLFATMIYPEKF